MLELVLAFVLGGFAGAYLKWALDRRSWEPWE